MEPDGLLWPRPLLARELGLYVAPMEFPDVEGLCPTCQSQSANREDGEGLAHTFLVALYQTLGRVESGSDAWIKFTDERTEEDGSLMSYIAQGSQETQVSIRLNAQNEGHFTRPSHDEGYWPRCGR